MSRAEIDGVKLEIEQPLHENAIEIRVRDHSAANRQLEELGCDVLYVNESGRENKVGRAVLRRSGSSDTYIGTYATDKGFAHGAIAKVVYKSTALVLPLATWTMLYFH